MRDVFKVCSGKQLQHYKTQSVKHRFLCSTSLFTTVFLTGLSVTSLTTLSGMLSVAPAYAVELKGDKTPEGSTGKGGYGNGWGGAAGVTYNEMVPVKGKGANGAGAAGGAGGNVGATTISSTVNSIQGGAGQSGADGDASPGSGGGGGGAGLYLDGSAPQVQTHKGLNIRGGKGGNGGCGGGGRVNESGDSHCGSSKDYSGGGGGGGAGVILNGGELAVVSDSFIIGGAGGYGNHGYFLSWGGAGGDGVAMQQSKLFNSGMIQGGHGGKTIDDRPSLGGVGVRLGDNSVLINNGTIASDASYNHAVAIVGNNATLEQWAGSNIRGNVFVADGVKNATYALGGTQNGHLNVATGISKGFSHYLKKDSSVWTLTGSTNVATPWRVEGGYLGIIQEGNLGALDQAVTLAGGGIQFDGNKTLARKFILDQQGGIFNTQANTNTLTTGIAGVGRLTKTGSGTLILAGENNSYTGETRIDEGTLALFNNSSLEMSAGVNNNSKFDITGIDGNSTSVQALTGDKKEAVVNLGGKELIITNGNGSYAGRLNGNESSRFTVDEGHQTLSGDNSRFNGTTTIKQGSELTTENNLGGTTEIKQGGQLGGSGTLQNLINGGTLVVGNEDSFVTRTINGDYIGHGGTVVFNTALGGDNSPTDRLDIHGNTSGQTNVKVNNRAGLGAQTVVGIPLISVGGQSDGTFDLIGDYKLGGEDVIVGGAYVYGLKKGGEGGRASDYYLTSQLIDDSQPAKPVYAATVSLYSAYTQALRTFNAPSTLQERVGNRYWSGASAGQITQGDGSGVTEALLQPDVTTSLTDYGLFWSKVTGSTGRLTPSGSTTGNKTRLNTWSFTAGLDNQLYENESGRLIGGVWFEYGRINAGVSSAYGDGEIKGNGYGGGASLTWYGDDGLYVDNQTKLVWYDNNIVSQAIQKTVADGAKGFGYALSLEAGKRFAIDPYWSLTPQAQLSWSSLNMDDLTDIYNATSSFGRQNDLVARLGLTANYANSWQGADGFTRRAQFYTGANLYQALVQDSSTVRISASGRPDLTSGIIDAGDLGKAALGLDAGGTYSWHDDKYSLFTNVSLISSTQQFGNTYTLSGNVGLSVKW